LIAISRKRSNYGITRLVKDRTIFLETTFSFARDVKVIGSSE